MIDPAKSAEQEKVTPLIALGSNLDIYRKRLLEGSRNRPRWREFAQNWVYLNEQARRGDLLPIPNLPQLGILLKEMRNRTLANKLEYTLLGLQLPHGFQWSDLIEGEKMRATVDRISIGGRTISSHPPQYFDILESPFFEGDNGETIEVKIYIHSHPRYNFYSSAELPRFANSTLAKRGGIIGLVAPLGIYFVTQGATERTVKVYPLTKEGTFSFAKEARPGILLIDYLDDIIILPGERQALLDTATTSLKPL